MNLEFLNDTFKNYFDKGLAAQKAGNIPEAKRYLLLAAETLKQIADNSTGELRISRLKRVSNIIDTVESMEIKTPSGSSGNSSNKSKDDSKEETSNFTVVQPDTSKSAMEMLSQLIGLEGVKQQISDLKRLAEYNMERKRRGTMKGTPMSFHMVFSGNPGTGKTTVARIIGQLYKEIGILENGHVVEVARVDLVGQYVGHTAPLVKKAVESALGGVLFIDEAYELSENTGGNDYGKEAINTLLKEMEDKRDKFVVIVAGYTDLMEKFVASNPGLKSRFNTYIDFKDYTESELYCIFEKMLSSGGYRISAAGEDAAREYLKNMYQNRSETFANGRDVRNFFEKLMVGQAARMSEILSSATDEELVTITAADVEAIS